MDVKNYFSHLTLRRKENNVTAVQCSAAFQNAARELMPIRFVENRIFGLEVGKFGDSDQKWTHENPRDQKLTPEKMIIL